MSEGEGPKLYTHKPRKEQLKQVREQQKAKQFSSPSSSSASSAMGTQSPPPKESFARRYKFVWPMLLAVNLAVGAYFFMRTKKKDTDVEEQHATPISTEDTTAYVAETSVSSPPVTEPVIKREPIAEYQQRELFKWMLEEKRKVKPKDPEEKRKLDEEKAVLKQFIRAKTLPNI